MTKLSDTQPVILSAAAQRDDLSVLPLPRRLKLKGGALNKVMDSLRNQGPDPVIQAADGETRSGWSSPARAWPPSASSPRTTARGRRRPADTGATSAEAEVRRSTPRRPPTEADGAATPAKTKPAKGKGKAKAAKPGKAAPAEKPTPRAGTKQALMIEMLKRPEGATVEQIAAATGWQHHTIRGAISGALKKKLGLTVEATRTREVGPNKTGAKGSSTVYRITGSSPAAG